MYAKFTLVYRGHPDAPAAHNIDRAMRGAFPIRMVAMPARVFIIEFNLEDLPACTCHYAEGDAIVRTRLLHQIEVLLSGRQRRWQLVGNPEIIPDTAAHAELERVTAESRRMLASFVPPRDRPGCDD
ncbi:hypothetical protein C4552_02555 [Candidatus Parcubacteria bacterium]|nr:MAG: hypothetical protein C4552_02555 [Candidatus Parcubacteria bacterium]